MKVGIFGGSFDPIHCGHLILAELAREQCELDEVRLVPAAIPPHKRDHVRAPDEARLAMVELALAGNAALRAWDIELTRGGVSFTVDTLRELHRTEPDVEPYLLLGADSLIDFPQWREPEVICELACLAVVNRPGNPPVDLSGVEAMGDGRGTRTHREVMMPQMEISSSDLRERFASGRTVRFQLPRAVEQYVREAGLYGALAPNSQ